jgi:transposase
VLKAQINKTDRNDARGIAQMMRAGLYRPVHVKTLRSQKLRMLLTHRKPLQSKAIAIENDLRDREVPSLKAHAKEIKKPAPQRLKRRASSISSATLSTASVMLEVLRRARWHAVDNVEIGMTGRFDPG